MTSQDNSDSHMSETRGGSDRRASSREPTLSSEEIAVGSNTSWPLYVIGGACTLAGIGAILAPLIAGFAAAITLGVCLVFCGIIGAVAAFRGRDYWHTAGAFAVSLLAVVAGAIMLFQPATGIIALGTLIIAWLAASGFLRIYYGVRNWSESGTGSGWMVGLGIASMLVALLLWFSMPYSVVWLPGVILGVDLIFWGSLLIALGLSNRSHRAA